MGTTSKARTRLRIAVIAVFVMCGLGIALTVQILDSLDDTRADVMDRAYEAHLQAEHLDVAFNTRLASSRGYLLTGDDAYLRELAVARADFTDTLADIRDGHPSLMVQLAPLEALLPTMIEASNAAIDLREQDHAAALATWEQRVRPLQGEAHAIIRATVLAAEVDQARARSAMTAASQRARIMLAVRGVAAVAALGILLMLLWRGHRDLVRGALASQEHDLLQILEHVPVGVAVRTADGAPFYANRVARDLLGRPGEHGYRLYEANTDQPYPAERTPILRALAGEEIEVSDMELHRDGGDVIPLHVRGGTVRSPDGKIAYAVAAFQDVRQLHRAAMRDSLTGLANRASAQVTFRRDRHVAARGSRPLAVGLIDLDHFKSINDRHGHAMGDRVLQTVAAAIVDTLRAADVVARWGGEELLVILPDTDLAAARAAVDRCLVAVRSLTFVGAEPFEVSFSAGVALTRAGESLDGVVSRADAALYKAKRTGRNRVLDETSAATGVLQVVAMPA